MKFSKTFILAGMVFAVSAFAQTEQWLEYHTGSEHRSVQSLKLTSDAPPGVALPKVNASPYFVRWATPMDPSGGRWICLDRSRKSGPYDRLYIDSTGNGRLDDKTPIKGSADANSATFPPVSVVFKGEDGPITYHLAFQSYQFENSPAQLMAFSAGWYEGLVNFDGVKKRIKLIDGNVNGSFNDIASDPYSCDRIQIEGDKTPERFLGQMVEVDGKFFRVEAARDGAYVKVQKATNVVLGQVHVPEDISTFTAFGQNGHFVREPANGLVSLPVGHYKIVDWIINRKDDKGAAWTLTGSRFPANSAGFDIAADKTEVLEIGEPVQAVLSARDSGNRQIEFSLKFEGRQQENITMLRGGQRPAGPKLLLADATGKLNTTNTFEFG
jgi:hypothetical protein